MIIASRSPFTTVCPGSTVNDWIRPSFGEGRVFSIFIASKTAIGSPWFTCWPTSTKYFKITPGIGDFNSPSEFADDPFNVGFGSLANVGFGMPSEIETTFWSTGSISTL